MTEKDLKQLKFEKRRVSAAQSGGEPFYYYVLPLGNKSDFCLITPASDEIINDKWTVSVMETEVVFKTRTAVTMFITLCTKHTNE